MLKPSGSFSSSVDYPFTKRFSNGEPVIDKSDLIDIYHAGLYLSAFYYDILPPRLKLFLKDVLPVSGTRTNIDSHRYEIAYVLLLQYLLDNLTGNEGVDPELLAEIKDEIVDVTTSHVPVENLVGENSGLIALTIPVDHEHLGDLPTPEYHEDLDDLPIIVVGGTDMLHLVTHSITPIEFDSFDPDAVTNPMIGAVRTVVTDPDPNATDPGFDGEGFYAKATEVDLLPTSNLTDEGVLNGTDFVLLPDGDTFTGEAPVEDPEDTRPSAELPEGWGNVVTVDLFDSGVNTQDPNPQDSAIIIAGKSLFDTPLPGQAKK